MSGHRASFLAGRSDSDSSPGQGGLNSEVTIQWKDYGVMLDFVPYVLDNGVIRLTVRHGDEPLTRQTVRRSPRGANQCPQSILAPRQRRLSCVREIPWGLPVYSAGGNRMHERAEFPD